jgi:hypothetical protein
MAANSRCCSAIRNAIIYLTLLPTSLAPQMPTKPRQRIVLYIAGLIHAFQRISLTPKRLALPSAP